MKNWAITIEVMAETLEEILDNFPDIPLGLVEDLAMELLSVTSKRSYELTRKEVYRRRIKYAATFILDIVRRKRQSDLSLNSAEAKAIDRIQNIDEVKWVVVSESPKTININKINERLKKRGYNIQIPCKDSPTG